MLAAARLTLELISVFYLVTFLPLILKEIFPTNTSHSFSKCGPANINSLDKPEISQLVKPLVSLILPYFAYSNSLIFQTKKIHANKHELIEHIVTDPNTYTSDADTKCK